MNRTGIVSLMAALALLPFTATLADTAPRVPANASSFAAELTSARRDQAALAAARSGIRNLFDLTRRLKLHSLVPISPYVRSSSPNYQVGREDTFWVGKATGYLRMTAKLLVKTAHAYWYVQDDIGIPSDKLMELLRASANNFETHVYPTDVAAFGQLPPGPDHDPRITVLSGNLIVANAGGMFSAEDMYPTVVNPYSNQRRMILIGIDSYPLGTADFSGTVAHELQHMIHWYQHQLDDTWINEGASMLAQAINGSGVDGLDANFAATPGTQVDDFCEPSAADCASDSTSSYGAAFQWMLYFYQHYGGNRALHALLSADQNLHGMALFDAALARLGSHDRSRDMFQKWVIANLVDDPALDGGIYGYRATYPNCCIHASLTASNSTYPTSRRATVNQFATDYVELKPAHGSTLHIQFNGDPLVHLIPNTPIQGGYEWWSNRGDEVDNTLTRALDLRHTARATLHFDTWYHLEQDYDYGYVEVSADSGSTWHTLHGRYTTNSNPNGGSYGNGYTGKSREVRGNRGGWLHESIDLTAFAGHRVLIRFEYIDDDAQNYDGWTLDNISIPEIGFADSRGTSGWQTGGWVRVHNLLPTNWLVQAVLYTTHGVAVRAIEVTPTGEGSATISGLGRDVQRVVLAISPTAPQTTVPSEYNLTVR